jgi:murein DD-endopeptidase MepM/ murein hydrolase activator NlpD
MQRLVLGAVILIIAAMLVFFAAMIWSSTGPTPAPEKAVVRAEAPDSGLIIPVRGVRAGQLSDTYSQARAGGARIHDAIDIMAPRGTPVVAAAAGTVEKLFFSHGGGGITAYVRSADGRWMYYYAHLDAYAPGLHEGQRLGRGDPIGAVGSTGNASAEGPHLHFAINAMGPNDRWWQGRPINPYPLLARRSGAAR